MAQSNQKCPKCQQNGVKCEHPRETPPEHSVTLQSHNHIARRSPSPGSTLLSLEQFAQFLEQKGIIVSRDENASKYGHLLYSMIILLDTHNSTNPLDDQHFVFYATLAKVIFTKFCGVFEDDPISKIELPGSQGEMVKPPAAMTLIIYKNTIQITTSVKCIGVERSWGKDTGISRLGTSENNDQISLFLQVIQKCLLSANKGQRKHRHHSFALCGEMSGFLLLSQRYSGLIVEEIEGVIGTFWIDPDMKEFMICPPCDGKGKRQFGCRDVLEYFKRLKQIPTSTTVLDAIDVPEGWDLVQGAEGVSVLPPWGESTQEN